MIQQVLMLVPSIPLALILAALISAALLPLIRRWSGVLPLAALLLLLTAAAEATLHHQEAAARLPLLAAAAAIAGAMLLRPWSRGRPGRTALSGGLLLLVTALLLTRAVQVALTRGAIDPALLHAACAAAMAIPAFLRPARRAAAVVVHPVQPGATSFTR